LGGGFLARDVKKIGVFSRAGAKTITGKQKGKFKVPLQDAPFYNTHAASNPRGAQPGEARALDIAAPVDIAAGVAHDVDLPFDGRDAVGEPTTALTQGMSP
jgi:hypothetical protein